MARINNIELLVLRLSLLFLGTGLLLFSLQGRWALLGGFMAGGGIVLFSFAWSVRSLRRFLGFFSPNEENKALSRFRFSLFFRLGITMALLTLAAALGVNISGLILGTCVLPASLMALAFICLVDYLRFGGVEIGSH